MKSSRGHRHVTEHEHRPDGGETGAAAAVVQTFLVFSSVVVLPFFIGPRRGLSRARQLLSAHGQLGVSQLPGAAAGHLCNHGPVDGGHVDGAAGDVYGCPERV
ncbi:hypothetical protein PHYPSEUDO_002408 [Phytophthora pseudosyringae]|uniref:Uncharacterized protein n=1 Tax=Phytophthora pseudosyringae TaxID=221518 RepID=A0A8T1VTY1_9STRA|nr:hypothetical protein PHYPSEUDO_002408 [Phytophthora pseudosyringae]